MNFGVNKITKRTLVFFLIGFILLLMTNQALYTHSHYRNGSVVVHAHPYNKSSDDAPVKQHKHSIAEFTFFDQVQILFAGLFFLLTIIVQFAAESISADANLIQYEAGLLFHRGREPPFALYLA